MTWEESLQPTFKYPSGLPFHKVFVPTVCSMRTEYLIRALLRTKEPVLLTGDTGSGKSSLLMNIISSFDSQKTSSKICVNARTTSTKLQSWLESKLEKRTKNIYVPIGSKTVNHLFTI